jgi:hypothetical protein
MDKLTQESVKIALWEALERLIPAYCDAVAATREEVKAHETREYLEVDDSDDELLDNLKLARSCEFLRESKKSKSAAAGGKR